MIITLCLGTPSLCITDCLAHAAVPQPAPHTARHAGCGEETPASSTSFPDIHPEPYYAAVLPIASAPAVGTPLPRRTHPQRDRVRITPLRPPVPPPQRS